VGLIALAAAGERSQAQELEPRAYGNTPVGLNFAIVGYGYAQGGVVVDPSVPLENADIHIHTSIVALARALDIGGHSGKIDVLLPYAWLDGTADVAGQPVRRTIAGPGDPRMRLSMNLYGAPALTPRAFATFRQNLIVGVSLQVSAPVGQYDAARLVNIGTHRWSVKPELGVSKRRGPWTLELALAASFYTTNHDFFGGKTRDQDPIYSAQTHLVFNARSGKWLALDATLYTGGRTTVDGVEGDDLQRNSRFGATLGVPLNAHNSIKFYASTGVSTRTGSDFDAGGIAWQYRWGGGL
jgi:hypothetical protein